MRFLQALLLSLTLLTLAGCSALQVGNLDLSDMASIANQISKVADEPDLDEEVAIGRESTSVLLGALGRDPLYERESVQRYVNLVGSYVASHSRRPDLQWYFVVSNDPDINAFAAPGGYIVVTLGLLAELQNEAQLAAVLAHEIVHVEEKHHLKAIKTSKVMNLASDTAMMLYKAQGDERQKLDPRFAEAVLTATKTLYARGLDKEDEFSADARAIELLIRAGYDPYGLVDVLQLIDANAVTDSKLALLMKTHPAPRTRLERLSQNATVNNWPEGKQLEQRFRSKLAE